MPEITLFVSSDQGQSRSADGSTFTFPLSPALQIPYNLDKEVILSVMEVNLWYTSPNVSVAKANTKLRFAMILRVTIAGGSATLGERPSLSVRGFTASVISGVRSISIALVKTSRIRCWM